MGVSVSWIAVKGPGKDAVLAGLDVVDTGRVDEDGRARLSCAQLPTGWLVIQSNAFNFASPKRIAGLSIGGTAIGCALEEHVMFSGARGYRDGSEPWWVIHDAQNGIYDLTIGGKVPDELAEIKARLMRQQDEGGGAAAGVDFIFDIPVELAAALCGYRHDESDKAVFTALKPNRPSLAERLGALFGRG